MKCPSHELNSTFSEIWTQDIMIHSWQHWPVDRQIDNLCWGFMAQSIQWGHVERGQFT